MAFAHQLFKIPGEDVWTLVLRLPGPPRRDSDWFFDFCQANDEWQFERSANGDILVIPLHGAETSYRVGNVASRLNEWAERDGAGLTFTNAGFILSNKATRAPDVCWVKRSRLAKLTR